MNKIGVAPEVAAKLNRVAELYELQITGKVENPPVKIAKDPTHLTKLREGTDLDRIRFVPRRTPKGFWSVAWCSYLVAFGPHAKFRNDGLFTSHIGFYHSPGNEACSNGIYQRDVMRVIEEFSYNSKGAFFVARPGERLVNGTEWHYLGLIKRYKMDDLEQMAADLVHLVETTYPKFVALATQRS